MRLAVLLASAAAAGASWLAALAAGCTFTGLDDYEIASCDPAARSLAEDACNALNTGPSCAPFQCDASGRCVERPRDADKDGDPDVACGGSDCDDGDATRSGSGAEVCDGADNDCDGMADEDVLAFTKTTPIAGTGPSASEPSLSSADGRDIFGAFVRVNGGDACVQAFKVPDGPLAQPCSFLAQATDLAPRQPWVRPLGLTAAGVAFVGTAGCPQGQLAFFNPNGGTMQPCPPGAGEGASLPAFAQYAGGTTVVVGYYDVALPERDDPAGDCAAAVAAPLALRWLADPASASPTVSAQAVLTTQGVGLRPPAFAPLEMGAWVLIAAPDQGGVGVWALSESATVVPLGAVAGLDGARAVAMATARIGDELRFAVVAETGCSPTQGIVLALAPLDEAVPAIGQWSSIEVAPSGSGHAGQPSVAWIELDLPRGTLREWWVSWVIDGAIVRLRRFLADGTPVGGALDGPDATLGVVSADGTMVALRPTSASFDAVTLGCAP